MREASVNDECWRVRVRRCPHPDITRTNDDAPAATPTSHAIGCENGAARVGLSPGANDIAPATARVEDLKQASRRPCVGDNTALITPSSGESDEVASSDWEVDVQLVRSLRQRRVLRVRGRRRPHRDITRTNDDAPAATSTSHAGWCEDFVARVGLSSGANDIAPVPAG